MDQQELATLRERISYDPTTGEFSWTPATGHRMQNRKPGKTDRFGYIVIQVMGRDYPAHRLAVILMTGRKPANVVDHINGARSDNRWSNLREATVSINMQNLRRAKRTNLSSGLLGVSLHRGKWRAQIRIDKRMRHLGYFEEPEQAHDAYVAAKRVHHAGCTI